MFVIDHDRGIAILEKSEGISGILLFGIESSENVIIACFIKKTL
jgi:hypothetical protein